tara:strand:+ start:1016 stop:1504 length:489 start_codon:yes stop_codon:yes gene_type:complete
MGLTKKQRKLKYLRKSRVKRNKSRVKRNKSRSTRKHKRKGYKGGATTLEDLMKQRSKNKKSVDASDDAFEYREKFKNCKKSKEKESQELQETIDYLYNEISLIEQEHNKKIDTLNKDLLLQRSKLSTIDERHNCAKINEEYRSMLMKKLAKSKDPSSLTTDV